MALGLLSVDRPDLISASLEALLRLTGPSITLGFSLQTRKKAFPNFLSESYQWKKKRAIKRPDVHAQGTVMLCLYYYVFVTSSYIFKMFLLAMFGKLTIVLHCLRQAYGLKPQWNSLKLHKDTLNKNCTKPKTHTTLFQGL